MFEDRQDAGQRLGRALEKYRGQNALVLAIPRGGVQVGYEVAKYLGADFAILVSRKLPWPDNPEAGFGAIAEDGSTFLWSDAEEWLSRDDIAEIIAEQKLEIQRRVASLRGGEPLPEIRGRIVILVDDGIAMGSTMRVAIELCKNRGAARIVVATPVAGQRTADEIAKLADDLIVLETPPFFQAVAQVYRNWYDVPDSEVQGLVKRWKEESAAG